MQHLSWLLASRPDRSLLLAHSACCLMRTMLLLPLLLGGRAGATRQHPLGVSWQPCCRKGVGVAVLGARDG
jgi:hypothetical protein